MKSLQAIFFLLSTLVVTAQNIEVDGTIEVTGVGSNEESLPFWMYANTNTSFAPETNFSGTAAVKGVYHFENASLEAGLGYFYRDGVTDELQRRDLYVKFQNNWLNATVGAKRHDTRIDGLSATNKNFLWSQNARPIPGLILEANKPVKISETFGIDWGIAHYSLNDDRYVDNTRVHYKRIGLITRFNEKHKLTLRLQHFAQWGGTSPVFGELPDDLDAFIDVFFAKKSTETNVVGEQVNALGNHLGTFLLDYEFRTNVGDFSVYHEHPFEDGSGTRWANFPDGVWGIYYQPTNKKVISSIVYEYIDTADQSGRSQDSGFDNYFSNSLYRSGWAYEGNIIGVPFIMIDPELEISGANSPIIGNRVRVHHFGVSGSFRKIDWILKSSYAINLGTYRVPMNPNSKNWHNYISGSYSTIKYGTFTLIGGVDFSNLVDTIIGGGVSYKYSF